MHVGFLLVVRGFGSRMFSSLQNAPPREANSWRCALHRRSTFTVVSQESIETMPEPFPHRVDARRCNAATHSFAGNDYPDWCRTNTVQRER